MHSINRETGIGGLFKEQVGILAPGDSRVIPWGRGSLRINVFPNKLLRLELLGDNPTPTTLKHPSNPNAKDRRLDATNRSHSTSSSNITLDTGRRIWPWTQRIAIKEDTFESVPATRIRSTTRILADRAMVPGGIRGRGHFGIE